MISAAGKALRGVTMSKFLGSSSFPVSDLFQSEDQQLSLRLRAADDSATVIRLRMGEIEDGEVDHVTADLHQKCTLVCEASHGTFSDDGPGLNDVFQNAVCKVYRFQTADSRWMLVREEMAECTLSFSIPKQLIALYIQEDTSKVQELRDLGDLSPHWDNLRKEVVSRYQQVVREYQETLAELEKLSGPSFKPSCSKGQKFLEFIPINLHTQRMRVTCPRKTDSCYDVITVGAPAAHSHGFKSGGLHKLLHKYESDKKSSSTAYQCIYYAPDQTCRAREVLVLVCELHNEISAEGDRLLHTVQHESRDALTDALRQLQHTTEQLVHALKDELVKSALKALHAARPGYVSSSQTSGQAEGESSPGGDDEHHSSCNNVSGCETLRRSDSIPQHTEYDEEEWDRVWAAVAKSLNCVVALVDKMQEQDNSQDSAPCPALADVITSHTPPVDGQDELAAALHGLKESVSEVVERARRSLSFVLLQEAACSASQGLQLQQRRDAVFSQALAALACGFSMRLCAGVRDEGFLRQLHTVGLLVQFESLLSTYSEEVGMLEDMEVGVSDLRRVTFRITKAPSEEPLDLQPTVRGRRECYVVEVPVPHRLFQTLPDELQQGKPLNVQPVLFSVGINEQQTIAERFGDISLQERINQKNFELVESYYKCVTNTLPCECLPSFHTQTDLKELLDTLRHNVLTKKRKNVEILWLAGMICRRMNGIRFTSCKSAKDRTSMSVTLEQCCLLRDEHQLSKDYFIRALDCMRREGCRIENVQKNIKCRKYAFNMLQLMAFPKHYRPPEGTYGRVDS